MPMHQPIGDPDPEPPRPDGTHTEMPRPGRIFFYALCRWCQREVDRTSGAAICPHCDNPQDPTTKETP